MMVVLFHCGECGWQFQAMSDFDGRHGRADTPSDDLTWCDEVAVPVVGPIIDSSAVAVVSPAPT